MPYIIIEIVSIHVLFIFHLFLVYLKRYSLSKFCDSVHFSYGLLIYLCVGFFFNMNRLIYFIGLLWNVYLYFQNVKHDSPVVLVSVLVHLYIPRYRYLFNLKNTFLNDIALSIMKMVVQIFYRFLNSFTSIYVYLNFLYTSFFILIQFFY